MTDTTSESTASGAPLAGRSVVVTRSREQAGELAEHLEALGAEVLEWPVIRIVEPEEWGPADEAIGNLELYDWAVFTSANGVDRFFGRLDTLGYDARALHGISVAAVGTSTAARLMDHGVTADYVPRRFVAEGVLEGFDERGVGAGSRILIPRALEARELLPETLRERGARVDVVPVYRTVRGGIATSVLQRFVGGSVDAVTFTSASTVTNLLALLESGLADGPSPSDLLGGVTLASIGPVTSDCLRDNGLVVGVEADPHTVAELARALGARLAPGDLPAP